jgi:hypothetical protein
MSFALLFAVFRSGLFCVYELSGRGAGQMDWPPEDPPTSMAFARLNDWNGTVLAAAAGVRVRRNNV